MSNSHDEIKRLVEASRKMLSNTTLNEDINSIRKKHGIINEQDNLISNNVTQKLNVAKDVEDKIGIGISNEDGEYETFGGFILSYLDRVPTKGEKIYHDSGIEIEILDAEPRKIKNTLVRIINKVAQ